MFMKKISIWASQHKWLSRIIIIISYCLINSIGLFLGDALHGSDFVIPSLWVYAAGFLFIAGCIIYPSKKEKARYKNFYRRQKRTDLFLISLSFLLVICFSNHYNVQRAQTPFYFAYAGAAEVSPIKSTFIGETSIDPSPKKKTSLIKQWKKKLRENIRTIRREYKDASPGERTALIVVTILVAILLLYVVAALSCSLTCAGSDALAVMVLLLGTGLIVFFAVRVIKSINRRSAKPKPEEKVTEEKSPI